MGFLLMLHSLVRWLIVLIGVVALVKFAIGLAQKNTFGKMDRGLSSGFSGLMDLQVLIGFIYFFVTGFGEAGFPAYRIEHMLTLLVAAAVAHAPNMFKKREVNQYALKSIFFLAISYTPLSELFIQSKMQIICALHSL